MSSRLCGLRSKSKYKIIPKEKQRADEYEPHRAPINVKIPRTPKTPNESKFKEEFSEKGSLKGKEPQSPPQPSRRRKSTNFELDREDRLSVILEILE
jgi:hypothetical protein